MCTGYSVRDCCRFWFYCFRFLCVFSTLCVLVYIYIIVYIYNSLHSIAFYSCPFPSLSHSMLHSYPIPSHPIPLYTILPHPLHPISLTEFIAGLHAVMELLLFGGCAIHSCCRASMTPSFLCSIAPHLNSSCPTLLVRAFVLRTSYIHILYMMHYISIHML